jgi:hypothetical protein
MVRLSTRGSTLATPFRNQTELDACLVDLGVGDVFNEGGLEEVYGKLGAIVGRWMAEEGRLESVRIEKTVRTLGRQLYEIAEMLKGHETGLRDAVDIEIVSQLAECMARDPTIGSIPAAQEVIASFSQQAGSIAHHSLVVATDLKNRPGKPGRSRFDWYDDFTALLLEIAQTAGLKPSSTKDRSSGKRSGWLFEAGRALEAFLDPKMRSPSAEACGQRLDRSTRRLRQCTRQKWITRR